MGFGPPRRASCHNEHVDRHNVGLVVVQEATPSRGGVSRAPPQIFPGRDLADVDAELEQFAVDAGGGRQGGPGASISRARGAIIGASDWDREHLIPDPKPPSRPGAFTIGPSFY